MAEETADPSNKVVDLRALVEARAKAEAEQLPPPQEDKKGGAGGPDDPRFVLECLRNNERGDGILFAALQRDKFLYNKTSTQWYRWEGHHWAIDKMNTAVAAVEESALRYQLEAAKFGELIKEEQEKKKAAEERAADCKRNEDAAGEKVAKAEAAHHAEEADRLNARRKDLRRRVERLRTVRGAANCLTWSHCIENPLAIVGDEIDRKPMLLACANGVIDLETGELLPGRPADHLVKAIPVDYLGIDHRNEDFERFIDEIHQSDEELVGFIRRFLGYCITGLTRDQHIACFIGEGANGKGTLFETLHEVLGDLSWSVEPEMILDQKNAKSSAGPSPDIISLHGKRLVVASETDKNRRISGAKVKRLTGSDTLTGRAPHDKYEINFQPTHKLVLYTNHAPKGLASDFAMFRRLLYIHYPLRFVDDPAKDAASDPQNADIYRPRDPDLPQKLRRNLPGILSWLVRGCLEWQQEGLRPPEKLRAAAEEKRRDEDHVGRFLEACCERTEAEHWLTLKSLYETFKKWYAENVSESDRYRPTNKDVADELRRKGYHLPPARETGGNARAYGLRLVVVFE